MATTCEITTTLSEPHKLYTSFTNTGVLKLAHDAPRFGKSNDILNFLLGTKEEQQDYTRGLLASSIAIFIVIFCWTTFLVFAKYKGPERFGWLSGRRQRGLHQTTDNEDDGEKVDDSPGEIAEAKEQAISEKNEKEESLAPVESDIVVGEEIEKNGKTTDEDHDDDDNRDVAPQPQTKILNFLVCFSSVGIIVNSFLLAFKGGDALLQTVTSASESIEYSLGLMNEGGTLLDQMIEGMYSLQDEAQDLLELVNGICPAVREKICTNLDDYTTCDESGIFDGRVMENMVNFFNSNRTVVNRMESARTGLDRIILQAEAAEDSAQNFNWALYLSVGFVVPLSLISLWIMVALFYKTPKSSKSMRFFQSKFIIPMMVIFAVVSFVFSATFIITSMAVADTCIDDPDARVLQIVEHYTKDRYPIVFEFIQFYMSRCEVEPVEIVQHLDSFAYGVDLTGTFSAELTEKVTAVCGGDGVELVTQLNDSINGILCVLANLGVTVRKFFQCSTWYPLYQNIMQDTVCYAATPAFTWIAVTQFLILIFTMIILTCRVVLWDLEPEEEEQTGEKEEKVVRLSEDEHEGSQNSKNNDEMAAEATSPREEKDEHDEAGHEGDDTHDISQMESSDA